MSAKLKEIRYEMEEKYYLNGNIYCEQTRKADIIFIDNQFSRCDVTGIQKIWNLDDWRFLGEVSAEIRRLSKIELICKEV